MAKRVTVSLVDDFDGESNADETVTFGLDGIGYEIDLSDKNAAGLRADLEKWAAKARRVAGRRRSATRGSHSDVDSSEREAIREWAKNNGHKVAERGRIAQGTVQAYRDGQKAAEPAEKPAPKATRKKVDAEPVQEPAFSN